MKFNVKIIPIGKYLSKYNIYAIGETKTISKEDGVELTNLFTAYSGDFRYPIYLTDSVILYKELQGISAQLLITAINTDTANQVAITLGTSKGNDMYNITIAHNTTNDTYTIFFE